MKRFKSKISLFVGLLLLPIFGLTSPAEATTTTIYPECGDTVGDVDDTSGPFGQRDKAAAAGDTLVLGWDVTCAASALQQAVAPALPAAAINIGPSNVTFDLHGFRIAGPTVFDAIGTDTAGILLQDKQNVTITDSIAVLDSTAGWVSTNAVTGFDSGVVIDGNATDTKDATGMTTCTENTGNVVEKLNVVVNVGIDLEYGEGILVKDSDGNTIRGNNVDVNGQYGAITLFEESDCNTVGQAPLVGGGNRVTAAAVPLTGIGIRLEAASDVGVFECTDKNYIGYNTVNASAIDGISILNGRCHTVHNVINENVVTGNALNGIRLNAGAAAVKKTTVTGNTTTGNGGAGIKVVRNSTDNTITGNKSVGNNPVIVDDGVSSSPLTPPHGDLHDGNSECDNNTWANNDPHVTEYAGPPSASNPPSTTNPHVLDYTCID